jgi:hypothetical protein
MRKIRDLSILSAVFALLAGICFGEEAAAPKFYKLDFVVKEVEGAKVLNARSYSVISSTEGKGVEGCQVRTGSKVPGAVAGGYIDVGVSIDCYQVRETQTGLSLGLSADISSIPPDLTPPVSAPPVIRQNRWRSNVVVPLKKPVVIFSSDDLTTKHQMQLELTATPIS